MQKNRWERWINAVFTLTLAVFFAALFSIPAAAEDCLTSCKNGPKDYQGTWSRWYCRYDLPAGLPADQPGFDAGRYSTCSVGVEGRYKSAATDKGHFRGYRDCLENFCIPKMAEICGEEDRCANPKNWLRSSR